MQGRFQCSAGRLHPHLWEDKESGISQRACPCCLDPRAGAAGAAHLAPAGCAVQHPTQWRRGRWPQSSGGLRVAPLPPRPSRLLALLLSWLLLLVLKQAPLLRGAKPSGRHAQALPQALQGLSPARRAIIGCHRCICALVLCCDCCLCPGLCRQSAARSLVCCSACCHFTLPLLLILLSTTRLVCLLSSCPLLTFFFLILSLLLLLPL